MHYINLSTSEADTHTSLSIGTENSSEFNLTDTPSTIATAKQQSGGGVLHWLAGKLEEDPVAVVAHEYLAKGDYTFVENLINSGLIVRYDTRNKQSDTLLCCIIKNLDKFQDKYRLIDLICRRDVKRIQAALKCRDAQGNLPHHDAVTNSSIGSKDNQQLYTKLCSALFDAGADKKAKDSQGRHVQSEQVATEVFGTTGADSATSVMPDAAAPAPAAAPVVPVVNASTRNPEQAVASILSKLSLDTTETAISSFAPGALADTVVATEKAAVQQVAGSSSQLNTDTFIQRIVRAANPTPMSGGRILAGILAGGRRKPAKKTSKKSKSKKSKKSKSSKTSGRKQSRVEYEPHISSDSIRNLTASMSRVITNQSNEIHENVIKTIMDVMNVDRLTAEAYKSILYGRIKEQQPNLGNLDRAFEMQKLATKEVLKEVSKSEVEERKSILVERQKARSEKHKSGSSDSPTGSESEPQSPVKEKKTRKKKDSEVSESALTYELNFSDSSINLGSDY